MSSLRRVVVALAIVATVAGGVVGYTAMAQTKKPDAAVEAQILISKRGTSPDRQIPDFDDFLSNQIVLMKSQVIAGRTANHEKLKAPIKDGLDSFRDVKSPDDLVWHIINGLTVSREKVDGNSRGTSVIKLRFVSPSWVESRMILSTLIDAYQNYLDEDTIDNNNVMFLSVEKLRVESEAALLKAEKALSQFRKNIPDILLHKQPQAELEVLRKRIAEVAVRKLEIEAKIRFYTQSAKQQNSQPTVQAKAQEWANKVGLEKGQSTIEHFLAALQLERGELESIQEALETQVAKTLKILGDLADFETEERRLNQQVQQTYQNIEKLAQRRFEANARSEPFGFKVSIITHPH